MEMRYTGTTGKLFTKNKLYQTIKNGTAVKNDRGENIYIEIQSPQWSNLITPYAYTYRGPTTDTLTENRTYKSPAIGVIYIGDDKHISINTYSFDWKPLYEDPPDKSTNEYIPRKIRYTGNSMNPNFTRGKIYVEKSNRRVVNDNGYTRIVNTDSPNWEYITGGPNLEEPPKSAFDRIADANSQRKRNRKTIERFPETIYKTDMDMTAIEEKIVSQHTMLHGEAEDRRYGSINIPNKILEQYNIKKRINKMNKVTEVIVEERTFLDGQHADVFSDGDLLGKINDQQDQIKGFEAILTDGFESTGLKKKIKLCKKNIKTLLRLLDSRG